MSWPKRRSELTRAQQADVTRTLAGDQLTRHIPQRCTLCGRTALFLIHGRRKTPRCRLHKETA